MTDNSVNTTEASPGKTLTALTWNIEGLKSGIFALKDTLEQLLPSLVFLSESKVFKSDIDAILEYVRGDYCFYLNSDDLHNHELQLIKNSSFGGTLYMWRKWLDPFVTIHPVTSPSFTPIVMKIPNYQTSVHIGIYLPTHGKDTEFVSDLADLKICIEELVGMYPDAALFIRGDGNVNPKNKNRLALLEHLLDDCSLNKVQIHHKTYHHFVGDGAFDSNVDILLHSSKLPEPERVTKIMCKFDYPHLLSHHDIIISEFTLPARKTNPRKQDLVLAPRITHKREKVEWSEEGAREFEKLVSPHLKK